MAVLACAACGKVGNANGHLPDSGAPAEAGFGDEQTHGTVSVTVLDPAGTGNPATNADVVFVDPDGSTHRAKTDIAGKVSAVVAIGASATSIVLTNNGNGPQYQLFTVLETLPGDAITLGAKALDTSLLGTFTVTFPTVAGATSYTASSPCGSITVSPPAGTIPSAQLTLNPWCKTDKMELVIEARDGNNATIASLDEPGVAVVVNGTHPVTTKFQGTQALSGAYSNIKGVNTLAMARLAPDSFGVSDSSSVGQPGASAVIGVTGGVSTTAHILTTASKGLTVSQSIRAAVPGNTASYGFDLSTKLLPWLALPTYDVAAHKITVPIDTTGTTNDPPDLFQTGVRYSRTDANNVTSAFTWTVYAPAIEDVTLPALPDELSALLPIGSDSVSTNGASAFDAATVAGYAAVRQAPTAAFINYLSRIIDPNIRVTRFVLFRPL